MRRPVRPSTKATLLAAVLALCSLPQHADAADLTRLAIAREAAAAIRAPGGGDPDLRERVAGLLFDEGACAEAAALHPVEPEPPLLYGIRASGHPCVDPLVAQWASLDPADRDEARLLHAAGAYLRRTGKLAEGEKAMRRAALTLAGPGNNGDAKLDRMSLDWEQLAGVFGGSLPKDLWEARSDEIIIYEGTALAASRLADYLPAAQAVPGGLNEAEQFARLAYYAGRPDLALAYLACLPRLLTNGSGDQVRAALLAQRGDVDRAAALVPTIPVEQWTSILFDDTGALAARLIDTGATDSMSAADRLPALLELGTTLIFYGDRKRADLAADRALAIGAPTSPIVRRRLADLVAELGKADAALDLIARATPDERAEIGRDVQHGAVRGGHVALLKRARARCGCEPNPAGLHIGSDKGLSPTQVAERFRLSAALIGTMPVAERVPTLATAIASLTTPTEWQAARTLIDAEPNAATRSILLVQLGHALINEERRTEATAIAERAQPLAPPRSKAAFDAGWLLHRVGRTGAALTVARTLDPSQKAELLTQIAGDYGAR